MASARGRTSIVRLLLSAGAKPDTPDRYGRTPLFNAVCGGHPDMVQLLLSLPDVDKDHTDVWGLTSALEAQKRELHEIHSLLCGKGEGVESNAEAPYEEEKGFCGVCLGRFLDEEVFYGCKYFDICRFCPPVETNNCPVCGTKLERNMYNPIFPRLGRNVCACKMFNQVI
jgi:hypothetical protein